MSDIILFAMQVRSNHTPVSVSSQRVRRGRRSHRRAAAQILHILSFLAPGVLAISTAVAALPQQFRVAQTTADAKSADVAAAEVSPSGAKSVLCQEAEVNPVTGHAECIRPRGAAVDPPPRSAVPCSTNHAAGAKSGCPQSPPKDTLSPTR
jgi:hypothetical protein